MRRSIPRTNRASEGSHHNTNKQIRKKERYIERRRMQRQCLNQMSSSPSPPGAGSAIGSVRRSIIFPRRSSLSRAASSFLSTKNEKGSASKNGEEHDHQAKCTASAAGSSPHFRRRRRPLKSCLSSSSLRTVQSSFSSSFSSLDSSGSSIL